MEFITIHEVTNDKATRDEMDGIQDQFFAHDPVKCPHCDKNAHLRSVRLSAPSTMVVEYAILDT